MSSLNLTLHQKQSEAFFTDATEVLYGGAAGGGKSHLFRSASIAWSAAIPGLQTYLFRRTYPDLLKNHMEGPNGYPELLAGAINGGKAKINYSTNEISFANRSKIHLSHCQYEKNLTNYQGAEIHVLIIDEVTHFTEAMYRYLRGRVRMIGIDIPKAYEGRFPRVLLGANPGGIGHNWVKLSFVDIGPPLSKNRMDKKEGGLLRQYIPARMEDNPALLRDDPDYESRLEGLGNPELVRAMKDGDWDIVAGGFFDDLWAKHKHKIIVDPFDIPSSWRVDRSFDWGDSKPFSVGWWAESDGTDITLKDGTKKPTVRGDIFRIAEWYGWNGKANEGCRMLSKDIAKGIKEREQEMGLSVRPGPADSSIFPKEDGHSIAEEMLKEGVRWTEADQSPWSRKSGWQRLRQLFEGASSREDPGLYVFENCRHFIRTVPTLPRSERDPEDVDTNAEDHVGDETRYRIYRKVRRAKVGYIRGN